MSVSRTEAVITYGDEPPSPRSVRWRVAIYPIALAFGALSAAAPPDQLALKVGAFFIFTGLMLAPLALRLQAWGGVRRAWRWFFQKRLTLTRGGLIFLTATILFGVAAINTGTNLLYLILSMLLSQIVVSGMLSEVVVKGLRISRRMPPYVYAGEDFKIRVLLSNPRRFTPSFALERAAAQARREGVRAARDAHERGRAGRGRGCRLPPACGARRGEARLEGAAPRGRARARSRDDPGRVDGRASVAARRASGAGA